MARDIAERTGGLPTLLRCRLLDCELTEARTERVAAARLLAADAEEIGMAGVAQAARALI
ncbi:hypothetical protein JDV09_22895 [Mycobacterium sp. Y57]|uniref:hypothetical protein n=1 Tax=Mycolicibacterium xanthum TaxID=2796469 RepID=UPI001C854BF9|nr:hypothetical protein [Mycolicibacterium xanthum]MBX7434918.1 hypothetical protein [Mycolicibacterium xanthum]